jgi:hypothetical protein
LGSINRNCTFRIFFIITITYPAHVSATTGRLQVKYIYILARLQVEYIYRLVRGSRNMYWVYNSNNKKHSKSTVAFDRTQKDCQDFSIRHVVLSWSRAQQSFYPIDSSSSSVGLKRQERETDHSLPTIVVIMKTWIYASNPRHMPSWRSV